MSSVAEVVRVSEQLAIAEHAEDTEDVTEQSVRGKLNLQFYQQKAWFDDGVICAWSAEHQAQQAPCSIRVVDSFGGGLSREVRETAALNNQLITEFEKRSMTSTLQVTDIDEAFRLKSCQRRKEKYLRKELMRAAELKGHLSRARGEEEKDLRKELMRVAQLEGHQTR